LNGERKGGLSWGSRRVTQGDFEIPHEKLEELNAEIERAVADYFSRLGLIDQG
jgi:tetrahydromethanopterin S-methyltransferase subunit G